METTAPTYRRWGRSRWLIPLGLVLALGAMSAAAFSLAVFTDTASVGTNTFSTGTVELTTTPASTAITLTGMAPGSVVTDDIVVTNAGTLALRYAITSTATNTDTKALKDALVLTIKEDDVATPGACTAFDGVQLYTGDTDSTAGVLVGSTTQGAQAGDRTLAAATNETLCFRVSLALATGNTVQNATTTVTFTFTAEQTANN